MRIIPTISGFLLALLLAAVATAGHHEANEAPIEKMPPVEAKTPPVEASPPADTPIAAPGGPGDMEGDPEASEDDESEDQ